MVAPHAHVGAYDEAPPFDGRGAEKWQPGVTVVGGGCQVEVDILGVEGLAYKRHVVLPADGCGEVDAHPADAGTYCTQSGRRTLCPDKSLCSGLIQVDVRWWVCTVFGSANCRGAYRHDLSALADDSTFGAYIDGRAVQTPPGLLNQACDDEDSGFLSDPLEFLPSTITPSIGDLFRAIRLRYGIARQLPVHPRLPGTSAIPNCVTEVHGALEVSQVFFAALLGPGTDHTPEVRAARVAADVGFREQKYVNRLSCGPAGELLQLGHRLGGGTLCARGGRTQPDCGRHG